MVEVASIIRAFRDILREKGINVSEIIIFGSHSTFTANAESDLDIAIISPDFSGKDPFSRARMICEARVTITKKYMIPLDILLLTEDELNRESFLIGSSIRSGISLT